MSERGHQVVAVGECMVELARGRDGTYALGYGGDTFNTAVYLARAGIDVAYATQLGDDPYSDGIVDLARGEGISTDLIARRTGRNAGLYLIETNPAGERSFHYWRDRAPARDLFDDPPASLLAAIEAARIVFLSGITLSLYSAKALDRLEAALTSARRAGSRLAMDGNFRPRGWNGDTARARATFERFWRIADIGLPSLEDEALLWGAQSADLIADRLSALGVPEIVVKCGTAPALCRSGTDTSLVPLPAAVAAIDTTAAGDSFNAAYLAGRLRGADQRQAALLGHRLAGVVVAHRGAVVPRSATAVILAQQ